MEKKFEDMTVEELQKRRNAMKIMTWALIGILLALFCLTLYQTMRVGKMQVLMFVPIALLPIVLISFQNIKKINTEIAGRASS